MFGIGDLISVGANLWGANQESNAIDDASAKQYQSYLQAMQLQKQMFDQQQANEAPWMQAGRDALGQMQTMAAKPVSFTGQDFMSNMDPAYAFDLDQGQKALERSAAARGGLASGGTLKDLTKYAQGMASNEYQNAYNRFLNNQNTTFGRLGTIAGYGQNANTASNAAAQIYGTQGSDLITGSGNAQAAATLGKGQLWGNTIAGIGSQLGKNMTLRGLMNQSPGGAPSPGPTMPNNGSNFSYNSPAFGMMDGTAPEAASAGGTAGMLPLV